MVICCGHLWKRKICGTSLCQKIEIQDCAESTINECISDDDRTTESEFYTTIEDQEMFSFCFPNVVYDFESTSNSKRNQKKGNKMTTYVLGRTLITLCRMI